MAIARIDADLLIPGRGDPIENGTVVVDNGAIQYAGETSGAPNTPGSVTEVPVAMPGLWECHGHFWGLSRPDLEILHKDPVGLRAARATADLRRTLDGGVTSVREVAGLGLDLRVAIDEGSIIGPHLYAAGDVLSMTGGHGDVHGYPLDFVADREVGFSTLCDGVPECLRAVRKQLRRGASVIKICASGGVATEVDHPVHQQFSDEELEAIVAEAARADRIVAAHCHGKPGIMAALRAGAQTIEHGTFLDEEAAELMKEKGAVLVATRFVIDWLLSVLDTLPGYMAEKVALIADQHASALRLAIEKGVTLAMGTDIVVAGDQYGRNGREIRNLIEHGADPLIAIEAATANGPLTLGPQGPKSGQLREGFDGDVIALDANPLDDPSIWGVPERVTHVWKAGELVKSPG